MELLQSERITFKISVEEIAVLEFIAGAVSIIALSVLILAILTWQAPSVDHW